MIRIQTNFTADEHWSLGSAIQNNGSGAGSLNSRQNVLCQRNPNPPIQVYRIRGPGYCCTDPVPWRFYIDPDPYHWITTDPDPLFSSEAFKMATKISFLLITVGTFTSVFKDNKLLRSHKTEEKVSSIFWLVDGKIQSWNSTNKYGSGGSRNSGFIYRRRESPPPLSLLLVDMQR